MNRLDLSRRQLTAIVDELESMNNMSALFSIEDTNLNATVAVRVPKAGVRHGNDTVFMVDQQGRIARFS